MLMTISFIRPVAGALLLCFHSSRNFPYDFLVSVAKISEELSILFS